MGFHFTEEDFERYVTMEEHGGRHIWHYLEDRLEGILAVRFTTNPFVARGDRLQQLWIVPKETRRPDWRHQAMFHLARSIEKERLTFGLSVECPPRQWAQEQDLDTNRDGTRVIQCLRDGGGFRARIDQLAESSQWTIGVSTEDEGWTARSSDELISAIDAIPPHKYWSLYVNRKITAEEAIRLEEEIVNRIVSAYKEVLPLWFAVIPEADRAFIREQRRNAADIWWVNQGTSYEHARREEILQAPLEDSRGRALVHWELLGEVSANDIVVHYYRTKVRGLSRAKGPAEIGSYPQRLDREEERQGRVIDVEYFEFDSPIPFDEIRERLSRLDIEESPFTDTDEIKQGYLWRFSREGLAVLRQAHAGVWPTWTDVALPIQDLATNGSRGTPSISPDLAGLLKKMLSARGLQYSDWQIATFYTALQTKGFVILSGISGTGKTKLAQAFAEILPQPRIPATEARDDLISITVQPYMPKYNRFIIPKQFTKLYEPPERGESKDVELMFDGRSQTCRLAYHDYTNTNYIALYLKGDAAPWFNEEFEIGDTAVLEPRSDEDGRLIGFHLGKPSDLTFREQMTGPKASNHLFVPVRTDWRDSKSLLGYYNPLTGSYEWTDFLRFVLRAAESYRRRDGLAWFVILDEMNLARVEYYFADLLSVLESGRDTDGWTREALRIPYPTDAEGDLPPTEIKVPPNLYVIGTVNVDETTHAFSPKVLDRAFTLELTEADFSGYPPDPSETPDGDLAAAEREAVLDNFSRADEFVRIDKASIAAYLENDGKVRAYLQRLNDQLRPYQLHFAYRVFDEIVSFLICAKRNELYSDMDAAFDAAVLMKVLPKFHGSRGKLEEPLKRVLAWCLSPDAPDYATIDELLKREQDSHSAVRVLEEQPYRYERAAAKACHMLWELYTSGFASFS
jgi:hypothetical protein